MLELVNIVKAILQALNAIEKIAQNAYEIIPHLEGPFRKTKYLTFPGFSL